MRAPIVIAFTSLVVALGGCYGVERPAQYHCKGDPTCPSGQSCRDGLCVPTGSTPDGAVDQSVHDAALDGPRSDQGSFDAAHTDASIDQNLLADSGQGDGAPGDGTLGDGTLNDGTLNDGGAADTSHDAVSRVLFSDDFQNGELDMSNWNYWRVKFQEQGGKLNVVGPERDGFAYGSSRYGRGAAAMLHIGDESWKDYRVEVDFEATGPVRDFNPHSLASCYRQFTVLFRVAKAAESWNDPAASTYYSFGVQTADCTVGTDDYSQGDWSLNRVNDYYIEGTGYSTAREKGSRKRVVPAAGVLNSGAIAAGTNKIAVEVRGTNIKVYALNHSMNTMEKIVDVDDDTSDAVLHGGVGFQWGWESLGWIDNVTVTEL